MLILFYGSSTEKNKNVEVEKTYPSRKMVSEHLPTQAKRFLEQAIRSLHAPDGSVMLTASAVDAMLKDKGYETQDMQTCTLLSQLKKTRESV